MDNPRTERVALIGVIGMVKKKKKRLASLFEVDGYLAVIPHIQNVYPPERDAGIWMFGFKYKSGVFEFFHYKTRKEAEDNYLRLAQMIDDYWKEPAPKEE